ncbi:bifunctional phosphoribosylaminoimidazolecarboxamide formyltransferase/IMP cyclohydrolase [Neisseria sp. Ec49-e6-T10]|uniref:bifunctional phosphoribosylaminoimidazolecarboxamide formyltransferase/IMP cyclohydrolase n=1 Tax=Neisseria sp. Ec49-e6-T10 TaxID=3140744 RepID=UPI003EC11503
MAKISRALLSVSDKTGIIDFAKNLVGLGIEILSTGGTAKLLAQEGICVTEVSDFTGFPEMLDGRVKTLHPKIHGGILGRRDLPEHLAQMSNHHIQPIDLVCVNLYPFTQAIEKEACTLEDAIENIDIGGPAMVRSAAKNWQSVAIVTDTNDYQIITDELTNQANTLTDQTRFNLARKAFTHTAAYDGAISNYLTALSDECLSGKPVVNEFPNYLNQQFVKVQDMRYGENPHQHAAFYKDITPAAGSLSNYIQLQGKELSYNNIADADAAWETVKSFEQTACVIVKHANPCGVAIASTTLTAYQLALATDTTSAFGGIIAFNREIDEETATKVSNQFLEVLIAPSYTEGALSILSQKQNVRVLKISLGTKYNKLEFKRVGGGLLVQTPDIKNINQADLKIVSKRQPNQQEWADLLFAWRVAKYVKSNAIVFCKNGQTAGIGAGQMSRVDSTRIAARKAEDAHLSLMDAVAASDAFFPFRDGIDVIAQQGIKAIIHPGGSMRDEEVIQAADEHDIAMVFTGIRHFRH